MNFCGEERSILFLSSYPPRECGIATFTQELTHAIRKNFSGVSVKILALNDDEKTTYNYPEEVVQYMNSTNVQDYIEMADKINEDDTISVVSIQHEFELYGGICGDYLLYFLNNLQKPVITTMHTVFPEPEKKRREVVKTIASRSEYIIVMCNTASEILQKEYNVNVKKIRVIPHGVPSLPYMPNTQVKSKIGYGDKLLLFSFGLISSFKGYEVVIEGLPEVIKEYPNLLYIIAGKTHPVVMKNEGENYRKMLQEKIEDLNLENNVKLYNKYLPREELLRFLQAADIYISSNTHPHQVTSGTLTYAMGCGRVVVSTPYLYAKEMLIPDRGLLAEFNNPESFKSAILKLLRNPELRERMGWEAYEYTRKMVWPEIAKKYVKIFIDVG